MSTEGLGAADRRAYIYALCEPDTGEVRYVGKTCNPQRRLSRHLSPSVMSLTSRKSAWVRGLVEQGRKPVFRVIEEVAFDDGPDAERKWIAHYRAHGVPITNVGDGGEGGLPADLLRAESRAKLSEAAKKRVWTAEQRERMSAEARSRRYGPEARANMSAAAKRRVPSAEARAHMSAAQRGRKHPPEVKEKIAVAHRGRPKSAEHRAHLSEMASKRRLSPEHRAKIRAAMMGNTNHSGLKGA